MTCWLLTFESVALSGRVSQIIRTAKTNTSISNRSGEIKQRLLEDAGLFDTQYGPTTRSLCRTLLQPFSDKTKHQCMLTTGVWIKNMTLKAIQTASSISFLLWLMVCYMSTVFSAGDKTLLVMSHGSSVFIYIIYIYSVPFSLVWSTLLEKDDVMHLRTKQNSAMFE